MILTEALSGPAFALPFDDLRTPAPLFLALINFVPVRGDFAVSLLVVLTTERATSVGATMNDALASLYGTLVGASAMSLCPPFGKSLGVQSAIGPCE
jgi:hypothetical protein